MPKSLRQTRWTRIREFLRGLLLYNTVYWRRASDATRNNKNKMRRSDLEAPRPDPGVVRPRVKATPAEPSVARPTAASSVPVATTPSPVPSLAQAAAAAEAASPENANAAAAALVAALAAALAGQQTSSSSPSPSSGASAAAVTAAAPPPTATVPKVILPATAPKSRRRMRPSHHEPSEIALGRVRRKRRGWLQRLLGWK